MIPILEVIQVDHDYTQTATVSPLQLVFSWWICTLSCKKRLSHSCNHESDMTIHRERDQVILYHFVLCFVEETFAVEVWEIARSQILAEEESDMEYKAMEWINN